MTQKVLRVGTSAAVTIPKESLHELSLKIGDKVVIEIDRKTKSVVVRSQEKLSKSDQKIAKLTLGFINRYRKDLEILAKK